MKFQATWEAQIVIGDDPTLTEDEFAEGVESEAGDALTDLGYNNVDVKVV